MDHVGWSWDLRAENVKDLERFEGEKSGEIGGQVQSENWIR